MGDAIVLTSLRQLDAVGVVVGEIATVESTISRPEGPNRTGHPHRRLAEAAATCINRRRGLGRWRLMNFGPVQIPLGVLEAQALKSHVLYEFLRGNIAAEQHHLRKFGG